MKTIINSSKRTNSAWLIFGIAVFASVIFLIIPSCKKDIGPLPDQESLKGQNIAPPPVLAAVPTLYYGHKIFTITKGTSISLTQTITNPNFNNFNSNFVLKIQNSSNTKTRVTSAEIKIDGVLIVSSKDFSKNPSLITKNLTGLKPSSILAVKLNGPTGSFIDLWIEGTLKTLTVTDRDGNIYNTVTIGTQVWMKENLKTTKYRNGDPIPNVTDGVAWQALTTGAFCWYNNDVVKYKADYGALYNWYTISDIRNVCPTGWHVPTDAEWTTLTNSLGGNNVAGNKLKETGTSHWASPNTGATNETGFTALPSGLFANGVFLMIGLECYFWTSTAINAYGAWFRYLYNSVPNVWPISGTNQDGHPIRCIKG